MTVGSLWCVQWGGVNKMRCETLFFKWKELGEAYPTRVKTPIIKKEPHASGTW